MCSNDSSKTVLLVYAHQDPSNSFNAALKDIALKVFKEQGYKIEITDLYAQKFDPRATSLDFTHHSTNTDQLSYASQQDHAFNTGAMAKEITVEMEKIKRADLIVFQTPVYWSSMPAILKGWFDKVLVHGFAVDFTQSKILDDGLLKGRRAMLSLTFGAEPDEYVPGGLMGDIDTILWPVQYCTLRMSGFDVLRPQLSHGMVFPDDSQRRQQRELMLENWEKRLRSLDQELPLDFKRTKNI